MPSVAGGRPVELGAGHDGAALHGDLGDFLVAGVAEVERAEVGAEVAGVAGEGDVPERVGGLGGLLDDVDLGVGGELVRRLASPERRGRSARRSCRRTRRGCWVVVGGVGGGVAELELLVAVRRRRTVASAPVMLRFWMLTACQGSAKVRAGVARMVLA